MNPNISFSQFLRWDIGNEGIDVGQHNLELILFCESDKLFYQIFHSVDEIFKIHLILVVSSPHDLDKDQVIVVSRNLLICHTRKKGQFGELRCSEDLFASDSAIAVENGQHIFEYIHLFYIFAFHIQYLLPRVVMISQRHIPLLFKASPDKIQRVFHYNLFNILVNGANLLFNFSTTGLMLSIKRRIIIRFQQPRIQLFVYKNINSYYMEAFSILFGKSRAIIILQEWVNTGQEFLSQLLNLYSQRTNVNSILNQLFPNNLKTSFTSLAKSISSVFKLRMVFIQAIVGQMYIGVTEILLGWLLVILCTKSSKALLVEIANIRIQGRYENIKPKIKLFLINEQRLIYIWLNNPLLISNLWNLTHFFNQRNSITLTAG